MDCFEKIANLCANVKKGDKVVIITDNNKYPIAHKLFSVFKENVVMAVIKPPKIDGEEPDPQIKKIVNGADVVFALTTNSITHTNALKEAKNNMAKVISMPAITEDLLQYIDVDYSDMENMTEKVTGVLSSGTKAIITSENGTNLEIDISGTKAQTWAGIAKPGHAINLPDGESLLVPKNAKGIVVIDGSMSPDNPTEWGVIGKIKTPIKIVIENNKAISIDGGDEADVLKKIFSHFGATSKELAEFAIGTNSKAEIIGNITCDEKAFGTAHVAFGNSTNLGGDNYSPIHLDGIIKDPTVIVDNQTILKNGKFNV